MTLPIESTGVRALDDILGGGIPAGSIVVVAGEPGSGKTILTLQLLFHAAREGRKCLYLTTLSEPAMKVLRYMQGFDFFDADLLHDRIVFADLGRAIRDGVEATLDEIAARVEEHEPAWVAIDSFRAIGDLLRGEGSDRQFVYEVATRMAAWRATALLVGEYPAGDYTTLPEFGVADGILRLGARRQELVSVREIEVHKLRGAAYVSGVHFFDIGPGGLSIYPRVRAPASLDVAPVLAERAGTGVDGLDELFDGGVPRGSATLVQGSTGTGKTLLSLHFLLEGVRRDERGILFTHEETPGQLRAIARTFGFDLAALEEAGLLAIVYSSPVELSTDRFLTDARRRVEEMGARRVVFDSLTSMSLGVSSERRFKELVYSLAKHMRAVGVTLFLTMEAEQTLGAANLSGLGVSFLADNLVQLRYVELQGRLERAISVIKARGIRLDSELKGVVIGEGGMTVVEAPFKGLRGVLTGTPTAT